jgi:hypothetical protein
MKKKKVEEVVELPPELPEPGHEDYFRILVDRCITSYGQILSDKMALDLNKVTGKMRTLILEDKRYIEETRSLKARQMLDEIKEIEYLSKVAAGAHDEDDYDPRMRGERRATTADKDMLNMRFKAAQMRRELLNLSANTDEAEEKDAVYIFFTPVSAEEILSMQTTELEEGVADASLEEFLQDKEAMAEGTSGKMRVGAKTKSVVEPVFRELADGTVEEL